MAKLLCLPLLAALLQCYGGGDDNSEASLHGWGFASDTTAILFYEHWEATSSRLTHHSGIKYLGWELMLVDVRFPKVYWASRISYNRTNSQVLSGRQWNASTMLIELTGEGYWLWTVGSKTPQRVNFNWNVERENYEKGVLVWDFGLRPWKNDSILLYSVQAIIDSKTMTVNSWSPAGENAWTVACDDFWWGKNGGICLINNKPYDFTLLSEKGDTLGNFAYTGERLTYYGKNTEIPIDEQLSYWIFGKRNFLDSLRNVMEH